MNGYWVISERPRETEKRRKKSISDGRSSAEKVCSFAQHLSWLFHSFFAVFRLLLKMD